MYWEICFGISISVFLLTLIGAFVLKRAAYRRNRIFTVNKLLLAGTFLAAFVLLFPIYHARYAGFSEFVEYFKSTLMSAFHALRLFAFDGGYVETFETGFISTLPSNTQLVYSILPSQIPSVSS